MTDLELMKEAWQALLAVDTDKRDKIVARLEHRINARAKEDTNLAMAAKPYFTEQ